MRRNVVLRSKALITLLIIGVAAIGSVAWAVIPDAAGVIHGCYAKNGGGLRVIDPSVTSCNKSEIALNWNVAGQPGPPGPRGELGATGPAGPTNVVVRYADVQYPGAEQKVAVDSWCNADEKATGGGFRIANVGGQIPPPVRGSYPINSITGEITQGDTPTGWRVEFLGPEPARVYAICVS